MKLTHASVFSGIGGPEIAATMLGWENVFHCEINPFGRAVLDYWFPNSKSYEDITKTDFSEWRGRVNVLTGGFPCQPFSYAGKRGGADDDRYLWPYMFKCIDAIRPTWVVAENVAGIITMVEQGEVSPVETQGSLFGEEDAIRRYRLTETFTLERICDDLERHGYAVQPVLVPACAVGAPHRRDRVFIVARRVVANTDECADRRDTRKDEGKGREELLQERHEVRKPDEPNQVRREACGYVADTNDPRLQGQDESGCTEGGQRLHLRRDIAGQGGQDVEGRNVADTESEPSGRMRPRQSETCESEQEQPGGRGGEDGGWRYVADTSDIGARQREQAECEERGRPSLSEFRERYGESLSADGGICGGRWQNFPTVSPVHRGNDGLPFPLDDLAIPASKWRTESLKAYGNAIVPQVMYEIFRSIDIVEREKNQ